MTNTGSPGRPAQVTATMIEFAPRIWRMRACVRIIRWIGGSALIVHVFIDAPKVDTEDVRAQKISTTSLSRRTTEPSASRVWNRELGSALATPWNWRSTPNGFISSTSVPATSSDDDHPGDGRGADQVSFPMAHRDRGTIRSVIRPIGAIVVIVVIGLSCGPGTATPESLRAGRGVYADNCSACHGNRGQGGVGPALSDVRDTWPSCDDHQEWIALGTERWKAERGPTYGANDVPIKKVMPPHGERLSPEEIAAVAAFQRVEYGGGDPASELAACGIVNE